MDWCGGHDISGSYTNMSRALNSTGRPIGFNMCEWGNEKPWEWGPALAQSWRITRDHSGLWASTKSTIAKAAKIPQESSGRPFGWNGTAAIHFQNVVTDLCPRPPPAALSPL
jgi:alpha-galactosidase